MSNIMQVCTQASNEPLTNGKLLLDIGVYIQNYNIFIITDSWTVSIYSYAYIGMCVPSCSPILPHLYPYPPDVDCKIIVTFDSIPIFNDQFLRKPPVVIK